MLKNASEIPWLSPRAGAWEAEAKRSETKRKAFAGAVAPWHGSMENMVWFPIEGDGHPTIVART